MTPPTPTSSKDPKSPVLDPASSTHDEAAKTLALFGDLKQPLLKLNDAFDGLHDQTTRMASLSSPIGTNQEIADLHKQLRSQVQRHKDAIDEIQVMLDELLQSQVVDKIRKEVEREIAEQMDKLVQERVAECLKTHIPQTLQDEVAKSKRELKQNLLGKAVEPTQISGPIKRTTRLGPSICLTVPSAGITLKI